MDRITKSRFGAMNRRSFLTTIAAGATVAALPKTLFAADKPTLVTSIRSLSNPYHAVWKSGAEAFAKSVGLDHVTLVSEGNSEKGIADIKALLAKTGGNMVLNSDPNDTPDARPIVEACAKAGAYVVTQWNKPADLHPRDFNPYYVSHIEFDGTVSGKLIAEILFKSIGGSGGIVALGGQISNTAAIERKQGLEAALAANPDIKLLDFQVANWKSSEAYDLTGNLLTRFGDQVKGIWAANDDMGTGALEALRAEGLAGKVPVVGVDGIKAAVDAVRNGEFAATVTSDPFWQGGMGLSIALQALEKKFDPTTQPPDHREFYGKAVLISKDNVEEYYKTNIESQPTVDWNDLWGRVTGPIRS
ncbi:sugar ABC transporter substrate-binding protein [Kaistia dalseonensis]|uniref:Ribose transport system substrate-binding protein n=1 Tax=Kaistia dalseonensis TaxID=410840 RepID=A0ABU0H478_9HYPH|nr:sugar ABC transporter substrate-binding protein [Kaistia dalseonensis]MCX5494522.1 sugar ABC transporter substrate-binding protein [Kaistia dalseonensis]MDQ0437101.1 ribose transport system substrate-binding protein [Kaistia dalseonensis]